MEDVASVHIWTQTPDELASKQEVNSQSLVIEQKRWRWLPFRSARPSPQSSQAWSPFQCLPAMRDLVRLSARNSKARGSLGNKEDSHAILPPNESGKPAREPLKLNIGSSGAPLHEDEDIPEYIARGIRQRTTPQASGGEEAEAGLKPPLYIQMAFNEEEAGLLSAEAPFVHPDLVDKVSEEILTPVVLDVGFAQVELKKSLTWPKYEFYVLAKEGFLTREGAVALLDYLGFVLHLPEVKATGFVLTYDVRSCSCPQLDLVSWIMHYISDPLHEEAWHERCVCWKVVVPAGMYFTMSESVLAFLFTVSPPKCRVFLMTDLDTTTSESWICYKPEESVETTPSVISWKSAISSGLLDAFFPAYPHERLPSERAPLARESAASEEFRAFGCAFAPVAQESVHSAVTDVFHEATQVGQDTAETEKAHVADGSKLHACRDSVATQFAVLTQGFDKSTNTGHLKIVGCDGPLTDEGLRQIMDFMDEFVNSTNAQQGFSITYDLRHLCVPSMSVVKTVAVWGNQPGRQATWMRLNKSCKVVVSAGMRFSICKGVLKSFFYVCPPVCRTFLLTDPDEPEETATVFEPVGASRARQHSEEDSQTEPEVHSDDGGSSCGQSADASETTAASDEAAESAHAQPCEHLKLGRPGASYSSVPIQVL